MTKGERRQKKQSKRRSAMRMAGGGLRTTYPAVVLKRAKQILLAPRTPNNQLAGWQRGGIFLIPEEFRG